MILVTLAIAAWVLCGLISATLVLMMEYDVRRSIRLGTVFEAVFVFLLGPAAIGIIVTIYFVTVQPAWTQKVIWKPKE